MSIFTSTHAHAEDLTTQFRPFHDELADIDAGRTMELRPLLRLVPAPAPVCPSWCAEHYGPQPAFPADRSSHHFAAPRDVRVGDKVVRMRVDRFDADPARGVTGEPVVSITVDGVEGFDLPPADALRFAALLTAQAGVAWASVAPSVAS